ncbi:MAG: hypothetical protein QCI38_08285, partial [Candidatus Thermoplasmatota archaeon]|nr:hypothetical protein [Candidatus Thermoplasmatota archaeon]
MIQIAEDADKQKEPQNIYEDDEREPETTIQYHSFVRNKVLFLAGCAILLAILVLVSANIGALDIPLGDVLRYLFTFDREGM